MLHRSPSAGSERRSTAPLSFAQRRLWVLHRMQPESTAYTIRKAFALAGRLDVAALQRSFDALVARHESLRTTFVEIDGEPQAVSVAELTVPLELLDLSPLSAPLREAELREIIRRESARPFDLAVGPLLRTCLLRTSPDQHLLLIVVHHIVFDDASAAPFNRDLSAFYSAFRTGVPVELEPLRVQYADYARRQHEELANDVLAPQIAYWREQLAGAPAAIDLPTDAARPGLRSAGSASSRTLSSELLQRLRALGNRSGTTLFMTLLAAFDVLLYRCTGQRDLVVGAPFGARNSSELEPLVGFFVNTLALRTRIEGAMPFTALLRHVRETSIAAYENADVPFERIVSELHPERRFGHAPFVNVMFFVRGPLGDPLRLDDVRVQSYPLESRSARFDLTMRVSERTDGAECSLQYDTALFDETTIARWLAHYETLLTGIADDPSAPVRALPLLAPAERERMLIDWNATERPFAAGRTLAQLFAEQVAATPAAIAVSHGDTALTYAALNDRANRIAAELLAAGLGREEIVGICTERSPEMVVGALAVVKAGGAYLPLDPGYPQERLELMLADAGARIVLTHRRTASRLGNAASGRIALRLDDPRYENGPAEEPAVTSAPGDLAYVIYTSGSTGTPKGVLIEQRSVNRLTIGSNAVDIGPTDVVAQVSNFSFDAVIFEMWGALLHGARLEIVEHDVLLEPEVFARTLRERRISVMFLTTALFRHVVRSEPSAFGTLRCLIVGGEALDAPSVDRLFEHSPPVRVLNAYGPTETTAFATAFEIVGPGARVIPIGRPISNTEAYILDADGNPVPIGVRGQLYLGGPGLARGYLNDPALTARKFVAHPFSPDPRARLYATGDLARFLPDGAIEFLGRADRQVKVRGFRIELDEVEAAVRKQPGVRDCVVLVSDHAEALTAYVVENETYAAGERRRLLAAVLPPYMVPGTILSVTAVPLTPNGKLDVSTLRALDASRSPASGIRRANPVHAQLIDLWKEMLGVPWIDPHDDFFALGGHSLLVARMMARVSAIFERRLSLASFLELPTIEHLAELLDNAEDPSASAARQLRDGPDRAPVFFFHGDLFGGGYYARKLLASVGERRPVYLVPPQVRDGGRAPRSIEAAADLAQAAVREIRPNGPYLLGGFSSGGLVAFETARRLRQAGEEVSRLVLLDTYVTGATFFNAPALLDAFASRLRLEDDARSELWVRTERAQDAARHVVGLARRAWRDRNPSCIVDAARRIARPGRNGRPATVDVPEDEHSPLVSTWRRITLSFRPRPYGGRVTLIVAEDDDGAKARASIRDWRAAAQELRIETVPGKHLTCITTFAAETAAACYSAFEWDAPED